MSPLRVTYESRELLAPVQIDAQSRSTCWQVAGVKVLRRWVRLVVWQHERGQRRPRQKQQGRQTQEGEKVWSRHHHLLRSLILQHKVGNKHTPRKESASLSFFLSFFVFCKQAKKDEERSVQILGGGRMPPDFSFLSFFLISLFFWDVPYVRGRTTHPKAAHYSLTLVRTRKMREVRQGRVRKRRG